jgi:hypothetical protein
MRIAAPLGLVLVGFLSVGFLHAADRPQWGEKHTRNMVSPERGLVESPTAPPSSPAAAC